MNPLAIYRMARRDIQNHEEGEDELEAPETLQMSQPFDNENTERAEASAVTVSNLVQFEATPSPFAHQASFDLPMTFDDLQTCMQLPLMYSPNGLIPCNMDFNIDCPGFDCNTAEVGNDSSSILQTMSCDESLFLPFPLDHYSHHCHAVAD